MNKIEKGFKHKINDDLILQVANSLEEANELAEFNEKIHEEGLGDYIRRLFNNHPKSNMMFWFYIRSTKTNQIVSAMTLLPLIWKVENQNFGVAEMGFVGTDPIYRSQGLFGVMNKYYEKVLTENNYFFSVLVGIPNYYRKFGYEFALDRLVGYKVPTSNIPSDQISDVIIRKAKSNDIKDINKFYKDYNQQFFLKTAFDSDNFVFRMMNTTCDIYNSITFIVEEENKCQGYFTLGSLENPKQADIIMISSVSQKQMIKILQFVKTYNPGTVKSFKVNIIPQTGFGKFISNIEGDKVNPWNWQIKILNLEKFFDSLTSILEKRIANSVFENLTQVIRISNYSTTISLEFKKGKIVNIGTKKEYPNKTIDLRISFPIAIKLFLSDRSIDEISHIISDVLVKKQSKQLIETLFPQKSSIPISYYQ